MVKEKIILNDKLRKLHKPLVFVVLILLLLIIFANAQNFSLEKSEINQTNDNQINEAVNNASQINGSEDLVESNSNQEQNESSPLEETQLLLIQPVENNSLENSSENFPDSSNDPLMILPIDDNFTENKTNDETPYLNLNQSNNENTSENLIILPVETSPSLNETNSTKPEEATIPKPSLELKLTYPSKVTRGEMAVIKAAVKNSGGEAKNLLLKYLPSESMESLYSQEMDCGDLNTGETCIFVIKLQTTKSTVLGVNKIKVTASYENE